MICRQVRVSRDLTLCVILQFILCILSIHSKKHPTAIAETTTTEVRLVSDKETVLEEMDLGLLTGFEEETT